MNKKVIYFLLIFCLWIQSCGGEADYPILYEFDRIEPDKTHWFVISLSSEVVEQNTEHPWFESVQNSINNGVFLSLMRDGGFIESVELVDENTNIITTTIEQMTSETTVELQPGDLDVLGQLEQEWVTNRTDDQFEYFKQMEYSTRTFNGNTLEFRDLYTQREENVLSIVQGYLDNDLLSPLDTIAISFPKVIYKRR